ncbi:E3 ubiquitin-protein ligase RFI2-like isoform X2 [Rutidosis leptorrhynchoides]|uniref:E3 ubiquitin-protein ligase RFI2-like isoform X2 n=1 Tax=Rutidosis leptorrhynchoides TaxID=125765 RepID=UPI003A990C87
MITSKLTDVINADTSSPSLGCSSSVPCSICFDLVGDDGDRSIAKLNCGHKFHLDCIGSAFNAKGAMQCPNCRKVENGRWLFAEGSAHGVSETGTPDWLPNGGLHDLSYSRRPFGLRWCPISGLTVHSSIEEAESSLNILPNFHRNHPVITESTAGPSLARSYTSSYRPSEHVRSFSFPHPLNTLSAPHNDIHSINIQHPSWGWNCHFLPYNVDRSAHTRDQADAAARSSNMIHPLHYPQGPIPMTDSVANSQLGERIHNPHTSYHHHQEHESEITTMPSSTNGLRRFNGARGLPMLLPAVHNGPHHRGFHILGTERDQAAYAPIMQESFHQRFSRSFYSSSRSRWP